MIGPRRSAQEPGPDDERRAIRHLRRADRRLAAVIDRVGRYAPAITPDPFRALFGSIVHQQVSMSAAVAIQRRLAELCRGRRLTPKAVLTLREEQLRGAGLSRPKATYVRELAEAFASGRLTTRGLQRMSDEEVIAAATCVKGVGRWTAEMLLIFCLRRADVWPVDDLALRKAVQRMLGLVELPGREDMQSVAEAWRPYRSYAAWYLWRSLDGRIAPAIAPTG